MSADVDTDYTVSPDGCWIWQGHVDANGYGKAYDETMPAGRRMDWAHRVAYRRRRGPIPPRLELDHTCENTRCINPDHLDAVTRAEHIRRTMRRLGKDERHERAAILRRMGFTYAEIAAAVGYSSRAGAASAIHAAISKGLVDARSIPHRRWLTDADRDDIRRLYRTGTTQAEIARRYQVHASHVSRICSGHSSGHGAA